jgi:hypothetical protein
MFHGGDQLPLGPHANRVLVHRFVDDLKCYKRGKAEILQTDADLCGALSDEADVRRGGDDFVDMARTLCGALHVDLKRQSDNCWKWVSLQLKKGGQVRQDTRTKEPSQASHMKARQRRQLAQLGRQPFELIVGDLERTLEVRSRSTQFRGSYVEPLELCELADFRWQRSELVEADLKARDTSQINIVDEPRVPHVENLQIGQQKEFRRKRRDLVFVDLGNQTVGQQSST